MLIQKARQLWLYWQFFFKATEVCRKEKGKHKIRGKKYTTRSNERANTLIFCLHLQKQPLRPSSSRLHASTYEKVIFITKILIGVENLFKSIFLLTLAISNPKFNYSHTELTPLSVFKVHLFRYARNSVSFTSHKTVKPAIIL